MIILGEHRVRRILREYVDDYHSCRTHLSLEKYAPDIYSMRRVPVKPSQQRRNYTRVNIQMPDESCMRFARGRRTSASRDKQPPLCQRFVFVLSVEAPLRDYL